MKQRRTWRRKLVHHLVADTPKTNVMKSFPEGILPPQGYQAEVKWSDANRLTYDLRLLAIGKIDGVCYTRPAQ